MENDHFSSIVNKKINKLAIFYTNKTNTSTNINRNALGNIGNKIFISNIDQLLIKNGGKIQIDLTTSKQKQETKEIKIEFR
jgi:hypothetical protein